MQRVRLTGGNGDVVIISVNNDTEALPGVFTVNANGKKVKFSPGNLLWDGSTFGFEKHQYDSPTEWNPNHVGHFFWSKDANIARAERFNRENQVVSNDFFAADDGAIDGYTVLSGDEWDYLIKHSLAKNSSDRNVFIVTGKKCIILKPDGFNRAVRDSYSDEEWVVAEASGLVALPLTGYRHRAYLGNVGFYGYFWSATPDGNDVAYYADFGDGFALADDISRNYSFSVRLVSVQ